MSTLNKILTTPGVAHRPADPGSPGAPGIPAHPAYCVNVPVLVPSFRYVCLLHDPHNGDCLLWQQIPNGYITVPKEVCYPPTDAVPPVPPTPGSPEQLARQPDYHLGWNSGADSLAALPAGENFRRYSFQVRPDAVGVVTGLGPAVNDGNYQRIAFAFYVSNGQYTVMENGVQKTAPVAYSAANVFNVVRSGTQVSYWLDATLIYTSTVRGPGNFRVSAALYASGDVVLNAALHGPSAPYSTVVGTCNGTLKRLTGFGSTLTGGFLQGQLTHLTGNGVSGNTGTCNGKLTRLTGRGFQAGYNYLVGTLSPLRGHGESGLVAPNFALLAGVIEGLTGFGVAQGARLNTCEGTLTRLSGFGVDNSLDGSGHPLSNGGFLWPGALTRLTAFGTVVNHGYMIGNLHGPYAAIGMGHWGQPITGMQGKMRTPYQFEGVGHGVGGGTLPKLAGGGTGTLVNLGDARGTLPMLEMFGSGDLSDLGRMIGKWRSHYAFKGTGHGVADGKLPRPRRGSFVGSGHFTTTGGTSSAARPHGGELPMLTFTGTGHWDNFGGAIGVLPMLRAVPSGVTRAELPMLTFVGLGHWVSTITYEAYSFTFLRGDDQAPPPLAPTHYTAFPFDHIVRWQGHYYGIGADGIYLLEGDTYDSAPIVSVVKTHESALGHPTRKRSRALYLTGTVGDDMAFDASSDEIASASVSYDGEPVKAGARPHRYKLARGLRGTHLAYQFSNVRGLAFRVSKMTPEIEILRNTIGD